jgi:hypothetical protein
MYAPTGTCARIETTWNVKAYPIVSVVDGFSPVISWNKPLKRRTDEEIGDELRNCFPYEDHGAQTLAKEGKPWPRSILDQIP